MRYSVLLSLFERDPIDLQKTYKQLVKAAARHKGDVEFCVVYDFEEGEQEFLVQLTEAFREGLDGVAPVKTAYYPTIKLHPETFHLDGHNNPVAVNNKLMDMAEGDNLVWVSSDMLVNPFLLDRIDLHIAPEGHLPTVWCSRVFDQDSLSEYCGPSRPFPMMWCLAHSKTDERHDLQLLQGFGFDDNDWVGRMALRAGTLCIDNVHLAIHQTHGQVTQLGQLASGKAYSPFAKSGWERSHAYMKAKWGGVPFDGQTLEVAFGEIGAYTMLQVSGVKAGPGYPLDPGTAEMAAFGLSIATPGKKEAKRKKSKK